MSRSPCSLFNHVQSYFMEYLPKQRGASVHTIRAYRDALTMLFRFVAEQRGRDMAALLLSDIDADVVLRFLDHIEAQRSNSATTRNCRRAAILTQKLGLALERSTETYVLAEKARENPTDQ